jgi:hypothetical protein
MNNDAPQESPTVDERKTRELCGEERDGLRCVRPKGHASEHEAFRAAEPITWNA